MNRRGYTLAELLVVIVLVAILGLLFATCARPIRGCGRMTGCANNLAQLWKMQNNYMVQYGGMEKRMPAETGTAFWLKLSEPPTMLIDNTLLEIYRCPFVAANEPCSYRGPAMDVNIYHDDNVVGADLQGNHGSERHNVILKSGDVHSVESDERLWRQAALTTTDGRRP